MLRSSVSLGSCLICFAFFCCLPVALLVVLLCFGGDAPAEDGVLGLRRRASIHVWRTCCVEGTPGHACQPAPPARTTKSTPAYTSTSSPDGVCFETGKASWRHVHMVSRVADAEE